MSIHPNPKLEVACFNMESAFVALKANADRIEYCNGLASGGTTPTKEEVRYLKNHTEIPIYVMIRPRGGDFCYNEDEFQTMIEQIKMFKKLHVDGFVFGILDAQLEINESPNKVLVDLAYPSPCTFHRAFDRVKNFEKSLEQVIACGFKTILTSGGESNAMAGIQNLKYFKELAQNKIEIMPGGGVRSCNLKTLKTLNCHFYHTSGLFPNHDIANLDEIKNCLNILNED
jgi:copper homeostasis protein